MTDRGKPITFTSIFSRINYFLYLVNQKFRKPHPNQNLGL